MLEGLGSRVSSTSDSLENVVEFNFGVLEGLRSRVSSTSDSLENVVEFNFGVLEGLGSRVSSTTDVLARRSSSPKAQGLGLRVGWGYL